MRCYRRSFTKEKTKKLIRAISAASLASVSLSASALPEGFVYLHQVDSSILQDMRYAGSHNFVGKPIRGYEKKRCILTKQTAEALSKVQKELQQSSLSLKVYDCYRPTDAVSEFMTWSTLPKHQEMKAEFYPDTNKADVFKLGYVAEKSGHSRGSTVDLTIVAMPFLPQPNYRPGQKLISCKAPYLQRYRDNSIDMGTGYDCLDERAYPSNQEINLVAQKNRQLLTELMTKNGFSPYDKEWWHFTLTNEPYPDQYFNFPVK